MIRSFTSDNGKLVEHNNYIANAIWYDLLDLTPAEKHEIESKLHIPIPSREKMGTLGTSNSFFKKGDCLYATLGMVAKERKNEYNVFPVHFIIAPKFLISTRYAEPKSFQSFRTRLAQSGDEWRLSVEVFIGLLETICDRIEARTETIDMEIDALSERIFKAERENQRKAKDYDKVLTLLGQTGDMAAKITESARSLERVLSFCKLQKSTNGNGELLKKMDIIEKDLSSLLNHLHFLSDKITFLLEAYLGYVTIDQNQIIKVFTILAVLLLPPALVASVYGMNFKNLPELQWEHGYFFALILMLISALAPYFYFKRKGWL